MKIKAKITWFDVGVRDAMENKPYRPSEVYSARCQYRLGYESVRSICEIETDEQLQLKHHIPGASWRT